MSIFRVHLRLTIGGLGDEVDSSGLCPQVLARSIDPNVHALDLLGRLGKSHVPEREKPDAISREIHTTNTFSRKKMNCNKKKNSIGQDLPVKYRLVEGSVERIGHGETGRFGPG